MAEYYPLLAKAVVGLPSSTPETRRAVYERARKALIGQLQSLQPPVPEADLRREIDALDAAVARLEAEIGGTAGAGPGPQPAPAQPQLQAPASAATAPPPRPVAAKPSVPPRPTPPRQPVPPQLPPQSSVQPPAARRPIGAPAAPAGGANRGANPGTRVARPEKTAASQEKAAASLEMEAARLEASHPEKSGGVPAPGPTSPALPQPASRPPPAEASRARGAAAVRPVAPQPGLEDAPQNYRLWIVVGVVVVVVALVAVAAWKLRDRPDQLTAFKPHPQASLAANDKNTQRVGGPSPAASDSADTASVLAAPAPAVEPAPAVAAKPAETNSAIPVAYRAALLVEAPDAQNKVKTYVGTVIWKMENVSNGPGQPLASAVHADIDVPDDKLKATIDIQKNNDPSLSASHTITVVFSLAPDSATGGVKEISLPQLRNEDSPGGEPLKGIVVPIMDNSFLVGLSRGDAEAHNADLLKKLEWIDIPIMLTNGRIAKLTFEKNSSGTRAINDAFAAWQAQQ
jgi:hypothetical protein